MNGNDQTMRPYVDFNLRDMAAIGSTDEVNIVAQIGMLYKDNDRRVYVEKGNVHTVDEFPRVDMGDYRELISFIEWAVKNYPAKKYFINVWNHGTGWRSVDFMGNDLNLNMLDVSYDAVSGNHITTEEMGIVMRHFASITGKPVELYGNDACLMAMIEIAAELGDSVSYFVSSQENEPIPGWPYDAFLKRWVANPYIDGKELGIILTEEYLKYYPDYENPFGTTFSLLDMSQLDVLMDAMAGLVDAVKVINKDHYKSFGYLASTTHRFSYTDYKDLYDFISRLEKKTEYGIDLGSILNVKEAFNKAIIKNVNTESQSRAHGLSVWLPTYHAHYDKHIKRYKNLEFNKKTRWSDLLEIFHAE